MPDFILLLDVTSTANVTVTVLVAGAVQWHRDNLQFRLAQTALGRVKKPKSRKRVPDSLAKVFAWLKRRRG